MPNSPNVDILIITAADDELEVVQSVDTWARYQDNYGYDYFIREEKTNVGKSITIALARGIEKGDIHAATIATRLCDELKPSCLAMVGICAGWREKEIHLGDVIVASKVFTYDTGKLIAFLNENGVQEENVFLDITTHQLNALWSDKARCFPYDWTSSISKNVRPISRRFQEAWLLHAFYNHEVDFGPDPFTRDDRLINCPNWDETILSLERQGLINLQNEYPLTEKGKKEGLRAKRVYPNGPIPDRTSPKVHTGAIGTGKTVVRDRTVFPKVSRSVCTVLALEMEASAIGCVSHILNIDSFIVVKGVSDFADEEKDNHYRYYAIEASYRFLIAFLKENFEPKKKDQ